MSEDWDKHQKKYLRIALVVDVPDCYGDSRCQVGDVVGITPISDAIYIIETSGFQNDALRNGAGKILTTSQKETIIQLLQQKHSS